MTKFQNSLKHCWHQLEILIYCISCQVTLFWQILNQKIKTKYVLSLSARGQQQSIYHMYILGVLPEMTKFQNSLKHCWHQLEILIYCISCQITLFWQILNQNIKTKLRSASPVPVINYSLYTVYNRGSSRKDEISKFPEALLAST